MAFPMERCCSRRSSPDQTGRMVPCNEAASKPPTNRVTRVNQGPVQGLGSQQFGRELMAGPIPCHESGGAFKGAYAKAACGRVELSAAREGVRTQVDLQQFPCQAGLPVLFTGQIEDCVCSMQAGALRPGPRIHLQPGEPGMSRWTTQQGGGDSGCTGVSPTNQPSPGRQTR